jgi:hypothetical protein
VDSAFIRIAMSRQLRYCTVFPTKVLLLAFGLAISALGLFAQAAAEAAGATSVAGSVSAAPKPMSVPKISPSTATHSSPHILVPSNAPTPEANRVALEAKAGPDAARLLLRSTPSQAQVWFDGKPIGSTPLLLVVPAGKYKFELRGSRQERAQKDLALLPRETREVAVTLQQLYPSRVVSH